MTRGQDKVTARTIARRQDKLIVPVMFFAFWLAGFWFMLHVAGA